MPFPAHWALTSELQEHAHDMMSLFIMAAVFGAIVGLALGLTGGGGSIFAMPLLIYGLQLSPPEAIPISLVAVGMTALVGALHSIRTRLVIWQPVIMFVIGGIVGAPLGIWSSQFLATTLIVIGFALLAVAVGNLMWIRAQARPEEARAVRAEPEGADDDGPVCVLAPDGQLRYSAPCAMVLAAGGVGTGFLSGLFGVGGGFLIVPALIFVTRMGVHSAVASSLLIIAAIGFSGAAGAIMTGAISWTILVPFVLGGSAAMLLSRRFARRVAGPVLQRIFAAIIVLVGLLMLTQSLIELRTS
jgi:uncharacterized membrane protein YfcA